MNQRYMTIVALLSLVIAVLGLTVLAQTSKVPKNVPLAIRKVRLNQKVFSPSKGQSITLNFEVSKSADIRMLIYDRQGFEVYHVDKPKAKSGKHSITWNGRKTDAKLAPGRVFLYVIQASTNRGEETVYNPADRTGGLEVKPLSFSFDKETGKLEYVLPKTCMIRLRAGLKDGMLSNTIFDWVPQTSGRHTYIWDGMNKSETMNLLKHPDLDINLTCYTLPENTIITTEAFTPFENTKKLSKDEKTTRLNHLF